MTREAICKLLDDFGLAKPVEVIVNLVAIGHREEDVRADLVSMVKFGALRFDGKHYWRP